jgi:AraC family transcriptional regulator, transcriptional activator of pobA
MANMQPYRIKTISQYHQVMGLPKPEHPLISVINMESIEHPPGNDPVSLVFDFYSISLKRNFNAKIKYGQQQYDFDEGIMFFMSPGQVFGIEVNKDKELKRSGCLLLVHRDFLWNTALAKAIKQYEYFDYSVHEALFLSDKEETTIISMM